MVVIRWHLKWIHKEESGSVEPISMESRYRDEITTLNEKCFPEWMHRKRPLPSSNEREEAKKLVAEDKPPTLESQQANGEETSGKEVETKKRRLASSAAGNAHDLICQVNNNRINLFLRISILSAMLQGVQALIELSSTCSQRGGRMVNADNS